jgi:hypothetical protein
MGKQKEVREGIFGNNDPVIRRKSEIEDLYDSGGDGLGRTHADPDDLADRGNPEDDESPEDEQDRSGT